MTKKQVLVKYAGYDSSFNQWIDVSSLVTIRTEEPKQRGRKKKAVDVSSDEGSNVVESSSDVLIMSMLSAVQELQDTSIDSGRSPQLTPNFITKTVATKRRPMKIVNNISTSPNFTFPSPKVPVAQRGIKRPFNIFGESSSYKPSKPCPKRFKPLLPDQGADGHYKEVNNLSISSEPSSHCSAAVPTSTQNNKESSAKKFSIKSILKYSKSPSTPSPGSAQTPSAVPTTKISPRNVSFSVPKPAPIAVKIRPVGPGK